ncbi:MAG: class I SAM-dependent methyltransferase [Acidobacteriota bacterium]
MRKLIRQTLDRMPYVGGLREQIRNLGDFPAGHYYSPIPSRADVGARVQAGPRPGSEIPGVNLKIEAQRELLQKWRAFYGALPFPEERTPECRYYFRQTSFCYADAIFLYSFLRHVQPRRIVEVGSGFSSAVMLDTVDRFFDHRPQITLIEPFPINLRKLLRPQDYQAITLVEDKVQNVPVDTFKSLQSGDLLFIDSSHVMKYGSDVQFLMFEILPQLPIGVFVHFHDVFDSFEYPPEWLLKGWYWNEDYVLRAFLSYNNSWEICLFGNYAVGAFGDFFRDHMPLCLKNPGGSLYVRRTA